MLKEITAKSALHKLKRKIPYGWDLNIYRGCGHGCRYCYALYSHRYISEEGSDSFHAEIHVKTNIIELLEKELQSSSWKREVINIGGVTDSYQPVEENYRLMPEILRLLIKYKTPAIISTKSDLILRDYDLIDELSRITYINVAATVTSADEELRRIIEPGASATTARLAMLKEFKKTQASIGFHLMPIIPYFTDSYENLENLLRSASKCGVDYLLPGVMYLRNDTRTSFFKFLEENYPELVGKYRLLYQKGGADKSYKEELYRLVNALKKKYNLSGSYMKPMRERLARH